MNKVKITYPEDLKISKSDIFIADQILPICINKIADNRFIFLFGLIQDSSEETIYTQVIVQTDNDMENSYLENLLLSRLNNPAYHSEYVDKMIEIYITSVNDIKSNHKIYNADMDMVIDEENKIYYKFRAAAPNKDGSANIVDVLVPRDNYIKLNIFFNRVYAIIKAPEMVFSNSKLKNLEYIKVKKLKHDCSATDLNSQVVFNHYTCECGPNSRFKFNYLSMKIPGRTLRNPTTPNIYDSLYSDDFIVNDVIYDPSEDVLLVLCEERSEINNNYKSTKVLKFTKEFYDRTNFLDPEKIYVEDKKETK